MLGLGATSSRARSRAARSALALVVLGLGACDNGSSPAPAGDDAAAATAGKGPMPGAAGNTFTLTVRALTTDGLGTDIDAMHVKPSAVADIVAHATPAAVHSVRFALLGAPLDAVLSLTESTTDATTGDAHARLVAPSTPTTFRVQATATGATPGYIDLAVPKTGMALLGVHPSYAGERAVQGYVASAWEGTTCVDLPGSPPDEDGPIVASSGGFPVPLLVPTDTKLAVTLRAARFAWGCTTVNAAAEGARNDVEVVMTNVPMKLDNSNVDFTLELDTLDDFHAALAGPEQAVTAALLGTAEDDVAALLDAMEAYADKPSDFHAARTSLDWDTAVRTALGSGAAQALRTPLTHWMQLGTDQDHLDPTLQGSMQGVDGAPPHVTLTSVFGLTPDVAGFSPTGDPSWEAGADDGVLIAMNLAALPTTLLLALARRPALEEVSKAASLADALAAVVSCTSVAAALENSVKNAQSKANCGESCDNLCQTAMAALVEAAAASDTEPSTLRVALTGSGSVSDDAELNAFSGSWLGQWSLPNVTKDLRGLASGQPPTRATP